MPKLYLKGDVICDICGGVMTRSVVGDFHFLECRNSMCENRLKRFESPVIEVKEIESMPPRKIEINPKYSLVSCHQSEEIEGIQVYCDLMKNHKGDHIALFEEGFIQWNKSWCFISWKAGERKT